MDLGQPAHDLAQLIDGTMRRYRDAEHLAEHGDADLDTDAGEKSDEHGPGKEIGEEAKVVRACRPLGDVRVQGELWAARCDAGADVGETVLVERIEGLTLVVRPGGAGRPGGSTPRAVGDL